MVDTKVMNILSNMIKEMFGTNFILLCQMADVFNFIHNKMLSLHKLDLAYLENRRHTSKLWSSLYLIENISIYCFDLDQMAAILDFTLNAITKVRSGHTPMSDMLWNLMVHTKIMIFASILHKMIPIYCFTLHK